MRNKQMRPQVLADQRGAKSKAWGTDNPLLADNHRFVNLPGLYFRIRPLAGLVLAGGWADRLTLWLPLVDMTFRTLRAVVESRI